MTPSWQRLHNEFSRFLLVGGTAMVIHWSLLWVGVVVTGLEGTVATSLGFIVASIFSYILNYSWTFRSAVPHQIALTRFTIIAISGLLLNAAIFAGVSYGLSMHYLIAQAVATGIVLFWNFTFYRIWSFRSHDHPDEIR